MHHSWTQQPAPEHTKNHLSRGSPVMAATTALLLAVMLACAATCARAATQQSEFYLLLEDGTKVTYGMLRELAGPNRQVDVASCQHTHSPAHAALRAAPPGWQERG
jgi:hypothetical protein